jgi:hypothetical protein
MSSVAQRKYLKTPKGRLKTKTWRRTPKGKLMRQRKNLRLKLLVMEWYGGHPAHCNCECGCRVEKLEWLTIDHIGGGGTEHRRNEKGASNIYGWLKSRKFPLGFRVLCFNCNCGCHSRFRKIKLDA